MTNLELALMNWIAFNEMTPVNGCRPKDHTEASCYLWAGEMAASLKISEKSVGGVITSLQNKGFVTADVSGPKEDRYIDFTPEGFAAWEAAQVTDSFKAPAKETIAQKDNNCTLVAVQQMDCGRHTDAEILEAFRAEGYHDDKGMSHYRWTAAAGRLGFVMATVTIKRTGGSHYITYDNDYTYDGEVTRRVEWGKYTLAQFLKDHPIGDFFVSVVGHALCVRDGRIMDPNCKRRGLGRRVTDAKKVLNAPPRLGDGNRLKMEFTPGRRGSAAWKRREEATLYCQSYFASHGQWPLVSEVLEETALTQADVNWDVKRGSVELVN